MECPKLFEVYHDCCTLTRNADLEAKIQVHLYPCLHAQRPAMSDMPCAHNFWVVSSQRQVVWFSLLWQHATATAEPQQAHHFQQPWLPLTLVGPLADCIYINARRPNTVAILASHIDTDPYRVNLHVWCCMYIYIYIWVSPRILDAFGSQKPQYSPCLALNMAKNISPDSGEIFVGNGLPQYKKLVFSPVLAVFSRKMLKTGEIHTFFKKWARLGKC